MLKYVFGPVPSRRLGRSLGIDPLPLKTCDFSCVYCQLGRTQRMIVSRQAYLPAKEIVAEAEEALARLRPGSVDWLTFVGSGETTLHSELEWMIRRLKEVTELPIAVITNGSLLYREEVRNELRAADAVLPSLDAAGDMVFDRVNRPHHSLDVERIIGGLAAFRQEYRGRLWLEIMLVAGVNDGEEALADLAEALRRIQPDEVQLNLPTRPPAEDWVRSPDGVALQRAMSLLGGAVPAWQSAANGLELAPGSDIVDALVPIIRRHPLREDELLAALRRWPATRVHGVLSDLADHDQVATVLRLGTRYYCAADAVFPTQSKHDRRRQTGAHSAPGRS